MSELMFAGDGFTIHRIVRPPLENNIYMVSCSTTGATLIVDAASDPDAIMAEIDGSKVQAVATTHGHWDHHGAIPDLTRTLGVPFMLHPDDARIADKEPDAPLLPGELAIGRVSAELVHTPGHTPGSMCILLDGAVLTGDTLFPGGPGATRFDHSSFETIIDSIRSKLFTLPDETVVLPGHGEPTTIGTERPHLLEWIQRGW